MKNKKKFRVLCTVSFVTGTVLLGGCTNLISGNTPGTSTPDPEVKVGDLMTIWYQPGYGDMEGEYHNEVLRMAKDEEDAPGKWVIESTDRENMNAPMIRCTYAVSEEDLSSFEAFLKESNIAGLANRKDSSDFITDYSPWSYSITFDNSSVGGKKSETYYITQYKEYSDADRELLAKLNENYNGLFGEQISKTEETSEEETSEEESEFEEGSEEEETKEPEATGEATGEETSEEKTSEEETSEEGTSEGETDPLNGETEEGSGEGSEEESEEGSEELSENDTSGENENEGKSEEETEEWEHYLQKDEFEKAAEALGKLDHRMNGEEAVALLGESSRKEIRPISHPTSVFSAFTLEWDLSENYTLCAYFIGEGDEEAARLSNAWIDYDDGTFTWGGIPAPWEIKEDVPEPDIPEGVLPADLQNDGDPVERFARLREALSKGQIPSVSGEEACAILGSKYTEPRMFENARVWDYETMRVIGIESSFLKRKGSEESEKIAFDPEKKIIYLLLEKGNSESEEGLMEIFDQVETIKNRKNRKEVWEVLGPADFSYRSEEDGYWFRGDYMVTYDRGEIYVGFADPKTRSEQSIMITVPNLHRG